MLELFATMGVIILGLAFWQLWVVLGIAVVIAYFASVNFEYIVQILFLIGLFLVLRKLSKTTIRIDRTAIIEPLKTELRKVRWLKIIFISLAIFLLPIFLSFLIVGSTFLTSHFKAAPITKRNQESALKNEGKGIVTDTTQESTSTSSIAPTYAKIIITKISNSPTPSPSKTSENQSNQTDYIIPIGFPYQNTVSQTSNQPTQVPTATPKPIDTPTPTTILFDASWTVTRDGSNFSATITANKTLKQCYFELWGCPSNSSNCIEVSGGNNDPFNSNHCSYGPASNGDPQAKLYGRATSIDNEVKEFGDKKPCSGNNCN